MSNTLPSFNPGDRVKLIDHPDTATVVEVLDRCPEPGCWLPALWVRRDPGSFAGWSQDEGLWHHEDTELVVVFDDDRPSFRAEFSADADTSSEDAATNAPAFVATVRFPPGLDRTDLLVSEADTGHVVAETSWRPLSVGVAATWDRELAGLGWARTSPWRPGATGFWANIEQVEPASN